MRPTPRRFDAVVFDLLTALLDSWSLWNAVAGDAEAGRRWRREHLRLTYGAGAYRPYELLAAAAAPNVGLPAASADALVARWDALQPSPEAPAVLEQLGRRLPLAIVTNCSEALGHRATVPVGAPFAVVVTTERARYYKPRPWPYQLALDELHVPASRALFVAGSPSDVAGASAIGTPVVWHNRLGLPAAEGPEPLAIVQTLDQLPGFARS